MNVLFATSEARPYIASGGLADVSGALPKALCAAGADCRVILPLYSDIPQNLREEMTFLESFTVRLSWRELYCGLFTAKKDGVVGFCPQNAVQTEGDLFSSDQTSDCLIRDTAEHG